MTEYAWKQQQDMDWYQVHVTHRLDIGTGVELHLNITYQHLSNVT